MELALLLPSRKRFKRLFKTLWKTKVDANTKFIIAADYPWYEQILLKIFFFRKIILLDDRFANTIGMNKAYNRALTKALEYRPKYCALWADDLEPAKSNWLQQLKSILETHLIDLGIFSTDEGGHKGIFGWNFFGGIPCAHFCLIRTELLNGYLLHPDLVSYFGDNEISLRTLNSNSKISLLPIRVLHFPSDNETRRITSKYYQIDKQRLYELYPSFNKIMDPFINDGDFVTNFEFVYDVNKFYDVNDSLPLLTHGEMISKGCN